jgi:hypothetical protein
MTGAGGSDFRRSAHHQKEIELGSKDGTVTMNRIKRSAIRPAAVLSGVVLALASCQALENEEAQDTEQMLAAAGFHMKAASTPEQLANLEAMTQRKIVIHEQDGEPRYVYADAEDCKCVYVGSEKNYDEYQRLSLRQEIAEENLDASMDWGMWGAWPVY